jgi:hypothetical protein
MTELALRPVDQIAADIEREYRLAHDTHDQAQTFAHTAIRHAMECGRLLVEMKAALPHGQWLPWVETNFTGSAKTATNYMRLHANRESVADLPVAKALTRLAERTPNESTHRETKGVLKLGGTTIDATAVEEQDDPTLLKLEDDYAKVIALLAEARTLNGEAAYERREDALGLALLTTRALKAFQESA